MDNQTVEEKKQQDIITKGSIHVVIPNMPNVEPQLGTFGTPMQKSLSHDKLLMTLYFLWDAFQRSYMDFFLIRQTAKDAFAGKQLTGNHIDVGVRKNEWISGNKPILDIFFDHEHVTKIKENEEIYEGIYQEVPFTIHLFNENECLSALIPLTYMQENFKVPNQFERFEREFDK